MTTGHRFDVRHAIMLGVAAAIGVAPANAQERSFEVSAPFSQSFAVEPGNPIHIFSHLGEIDVRGGGGTAVEVSAETAGGRSVDLRIVVLRDGERLVVCMLPRDRGECSDGGVRIRGGRSDAQRRVPVRLTVIVPHPSSVRVGSGNGAVSVRGLEGEVGASSGNGAVHVEDVGGPVRASSGNGSVTVHTRGGPVSASTGNGHITATMSRVPADARLEFSSGNGNIEVRLPPDFEGHVDFRTGNGGVESDFPITFVGRSSRHRVQGTIGKGGAGIRANTGSGDLVLRHP